MTVGDKSAQSWGWPAILTDPVEDGGDVTIPAPGFDHRYTDTRYADVTVGAMTYRAGKPTENGKSVDAVFNAPSHEEPVTITLTNHTGAAWQGGDSLYVFCPHLLATGANEYDLKEQIWDLEQRVKALEDQTVVTMEDVEVEENHAKKSHKKGK